MERHERYDPEDIESLLSERGFDELLDAERAFVLRHLSGRDEYERMRALLHYMRPDERSRPGIEPDERVRRNVMDVFRAQQRPQWRIWLNSMASWSMPQRTSGYWRPALAFGTLALLVVAGVLAVRQFNDGHEHAELAEVKQVVPLPKEDAAPAIAKEEAMNEDSAVEQPQADPAGELASTGTATDADRMEREATIDAETSLDVLDDAQAIGLSDTGTFTEDVAARSSLNEVDAKFAPTTTSTATAPPATGHVVTSDELARNMSYANVSVGTKESATRKRAAAAEKSVLTSSTSRSMARDPELLGLLSAGW
jgi:hypothetical protein